MIRLRVHMEFLKMSLSNDEYSSGDSNRVADRQKVVEIPENHHVLSPNMNVGVRVRPHLHEVWIGIIADINKNILVFPF